VNFDKIIFLDIDGVLNTDTFLESKVVTTGWGGRVIPKPIDMIDPEKVEILNRIVAETGAVIVLSSSWRINPGAAETVDCLLANGLEARVVGATPDRVQVTGRFSGYCQRWEEIAKWIDDNKFKGNFVIFDDYEDASCPEFESNFFLTDEQVGLTDKIADAAIKVLLA
jgi:hypothetical protein